MTGPLAQQFAQVREALDEICPQEYAIDCDLPEHQTVRDGHAALSVIERHVQDMRENIVLALPDHGGRCGGTDEKPAALDQSDRFANPCIRCRVLLAFDAALPASGEKGEK